MLNSVHIRSATRQDLPEMLKIFNYEIVHTPYVYIYHAWTLEYFTNWFEEKQLNGFPVLVAETNHRLAGYATYGRFRNREAYNTTVEYSVYIHLNHRKQGIAKNLVHELIKIAKEQGLHSMIGGLDAENKASHEFHKKMGFKEVANIKSVAKKFDEWRDLVLFQLMLSND